MKKFIALFLTVFMCAFMLIGCDQKEPIEPDYTKAPDTTSTESTTGQPPIGESTLGWDYEKIDLSGKKYVPSSADADESAIKFGRKVGTYEYEYFKALSGISLQTMVADSYARYPNDAEDGFVTTYLNTVGIEEYIAPYESILYHAFTLLSDCNFAFPVSTLDLVNGYWSSVSYELCGEEKYTTLGLSFNGIDEKLTEYANILLALSEKYPDYKGEFVLSDTARAAAEALVEACKPVAEKRDALRESWRAYYHANEPTMEVKEEFDAEHEAVKVTITGNGRYILHGNISGEYIENYRYEIRIDEESGEEWVNSLPMESPVVVYIPLSLYYFFDEFRVQTINEVGRTFEDSFVLKTNPADYYSHEPLTMNNAFLDAALRDYFGGDYSEADLLKIRIVELFYTPDFFDASKGPQVKFTTYKNEETFYYYADLIDGEFTFEMPEGTFEDFFHFKTLSRVFVVDKEHGKGYTLPQELQEFLSWEYQVTENTWDKPHDHDHS